MTARVCGPQRECIIANREPDSAIKLELRDDYSSASCARGPRLMVIAPGLRPAQMNRQGGPGIRSEADIGGTGELRQEPTFENG